MEEKDIKKLNNQLFSIAKGDYSALDDLYLSFGGAMFSVAVSITKNASDAEDCVSETLLKIAQKSSYFRGGNGYAWLLTVTRNTALNLLKKAAAVESLPDESFFPLSDAFPFTEKSDLTVCVESAMNSLTDKEKQAVYFYYFAEFTVREAAKKMKISKSAMQRLLDCAEKKLKKLLL